jgi:hypothetical protein
MGRATTGCSLEEVVDIYSTFEGTKRARWVMVLQLVSSFIPGLALIIAEIHVRKVKEFTENPPNAKFFKSWECGNDEIVLTLTWFSLGSNTRKLTLLLTLDILINKLLLLFAIGFEVLLGVVSNGACDRFCCLVLPVEIAEI